MTEKKAKPKAAKKSAEKKQPAAKSEKKPPQKKAQEKKQAPKKAAAAVGGEAPEKPARKEEGKSDAVEAKAARKAAAKPRVKEAKKGEVEAKKERPIAKIQFKPSGKTSAGKYKPTFRRQEGLRYKRLKEVWRRPTGIDSKKLEKQRGKGLLPSIGYKKPLNASGLQYGFEPVRVFTVNELKNVQPEKQAAVIAAPVGRRKRNMIIEEANRLKITILNPRRGEI